MVGPSTRGLRRPLNYAALHKRGFASVKANKTKRLITKKKVVSAPSSPTIQLNINEHDNVDSTLLEAIKQLNKQNKLKGKLKQNKKIIKQKKKDKHDKSGEGQIGEGAGNSKDNSGVTDKGDQPEHIPLYELEPSSDDSLLTDIVVVNSMDKAWKRLTLQEKKKLLQEEIANMEDELEDEDEELKELLKRKDELEKRKAGGEKGKAGTSSKTGKKGKSSDKTRNKSSAMIQSQAEDFERELKSKLPSIEHIEQLLHVSDKKIKSRKSRKLKKKSSRRNKRKRSSSSDSSDYETSTSDSENESDSTGEDSSSEDDRKHRKRKGKKLRSGIYVKPGNANIVSNELFAQTTVEETPKIKGEISFNLLVAGELEILTNFKISKKERFTRLEVLKKLAYKAEHLPQEEITRLYSNFINKVERGVFKWGSKSDLRSFEQQLVYSISVDTRRQEGKNKRSAKFEERKKYCLDYNRGTCKFDKGHEGRINGQTFFKLHVCKRCLVQDGLEVNHPEKDCVKNK